MGVGFQNLFEVIMRGTNEEGIVRQRMLGGNLKFILQQLMGEHRWNGVGHLHKTGNTSGHSSTRFTVNSCLVREAWLSKMHLIINGARKKMLSCRINNRIG
jgi:hypothetical protein